MREHIHSLRVSNEAALFARKQEASEVVRHAAALLFGTFLVTIIIAYTTARIYTDKLFRPIYEVTQNLKAVRQGNMGRKTSVQASDELGSLAQEFNNMTQRLQEFEQSTMGQLMAERNRHHGHCAKHHRADGNPRRQLLHHLNQPVLRPAFLGRDG